MPSFVFFPPGRKVGGGGGGGGGAGILNHHSRLKQLDISSNQGGSQYTKMQILDRRMRMRL